MGRSLSDLDNTDVVDDDADDEDEEEEDGGADTSEAVRRNATTSSEARGQKSFLSGWTSMFEGGRRGWWIDTAASGFHFVLDAIDKMPE